MHNIKKRIKEELEFLDKKFETVELNEQSLHLIKELCKTLYYIDAACGILDKHKHVKGFDKEVEKKDIDHLKESYL